MSGGASSDPKSSGKQPERPTDVNTKTRDTQTDIKAVANATTEQTDLKSDLIAVLGEQEGTHAFKVLTNSQFKCASFVDLTLLTPAIWENLESQYGLGAIPALKLHSAVMQRLIDRNHKTAAAAREMAVTATQQGHIQAGAMGPNAQQNIYYYYGSGGSGGSGAGALAPPATNHFYFVLLSHAQPDEFLNGSKRNDSKITTAGLLTVSENVVRPDILTAKHFRSRDAKSSKDDPAWNYMFQRSKNERSLPDFIESYKPAANQWVFTFHDSLPDGCYIVLQTSDSSQFAMTINNALSDALGCALGIRLAHSFPRCPFDVFECIGINSSLSTVGNEMVRIQVALQQSARACSLIAVLPSYIRSTPQPPVDLKADTKTVPVVALPITATAPEETGRPAPKLWSVHSQPIKKSMWEYLSAVIPDCFLVEEPHARIPVGLEGPSPADDETLVGPAAPGAKPKPIATTTGTGTSNPIGVKDLVVTKMTGSTAAYDLFCGIDQSYKLLIPWIRDVGAVTPAGWDSEVPKNHAVMCDMVGCYGQMFLVSRLLSRGEQEHWKYDCAERCVPIHARKNGAFWDSGTKLTVAFIGTPDLAIQKRVKTCAEKWLNWVDTLPEAQRFPLSISFDWTTCTNDPGKAHIRVQIDYLSGNTWSKIGRQSINPSYFKNGQYQRFPSMVIGVKGYSSDRLDANILHVFGHALGFDHELQHPLKPFRFVESTVKYADRFKHWTFDRICAHALEPIEYALQNTHMYDEKSIMNYDYPQEWIQPAGTGVAVVAIEINTKLSEIDQFFVWSRYYPRNRVVSPPFQDQTAATMKRTEKLKEDLSTVPTGLVEGFKKMLTPSRAWQALTHPIDPTNWLICGFDDSNSLRVQNTGLKGLNQLICEFDEKQVQVAVLRVGCIVGPGKETDPEYVLITFVGKSVIGARRNLVGDKQQQIFAAFPGITCRIDLIDSAPGNLSHVSIGKSLPIRARRRIFHYNFGGKNQRLHVTEKGVIENHTLF